MKNNILKVLLVNIVCIAVVLIVFDFYYMYKNVENLRPHYSVVEEAFRTPKNIVKYYINRYTIYFKRFINYPKILDNALIYDIEHRYRPIENPDSNEKSIIIFGCSFAHGDKLTDNETFSYQLGKITGLPVYNRAYSGRAPQYMLYQLLNPDFYKIIKTEPEFVIYVYYYDQILRLFAPCHYFNSGGVYSEPSLFFKKKSDKFIPNKYPSITTASPLMIKAKREYYQRKLYNPNHYSKSADILYDYFNASRMAICKKYPNTKFIIVSYKPDIIMKIAEEKLRENGFYIFEVDQDLIEQEEFRFYDSHPSAYAWEYFTPQIVDFLNQIRAENN